jgi:hypothetical protein
MTHLGFTSVRIFTPVDGQLKTGVILRRVHYDFEILKGLNASYSALYAQE